MEEVKNKYSIGAHRRTTNRIGTSTETTMTLCAKSLYIFRISDRRKGKKKKKNLLNEFITSAIDNANAKISLFNMNVVSTTKKTEIILPDQV